MDLHAGHAILGDLSLVVELPRTHMDIQTNIRDTRLLDKTNTATELGGSAVTSRDLEVPATSQQWRHLSHHTQHGISSGGIFSSPWMPTYGNCPCP